MSETELFAIALAAVPTMLTVVTGILINNARLTDFRVQMDVRFDEICRAWSKR